MGINKCDFDFETWYDLLKDLANKHGVNEKPDPNE